MDLITAATAAHWFDMDRFWPAAARVLKPGGSVAIWTAGEACMHPSMPNAAAIQAALNEINEKEIKPFTLPGNVLAQYLYVDLALPWALAQPVAEFDEGTFLRKEWASGEGFLEMSGITADLDMFERILGTMSPIQRWRDANPEKVGTEEDILRRQRRVIERLLHEAGVEKGKEWVKGSIKGVLLMVKKKA